MSWVLLRDISIAGLIALCVFFYIGKNTAVANLARAEAAHSAALKASAEGQARREAEARKQEQMIRDEYDLYKEETKNEIVSVNQRTADLLERVRYYQNQSGRESLPAGTAGSDTQVGEITKPHSGSLVLGQIGAEDVEEAARAEHIRLMYLQCYDTYEYVRKTLSK